jgi:hypothetical protein
MLDEARENLAGERNVIFHRADGFHLAGFPDASFDLVYAHDVFVTFDLNQALALLDEAHRRAYTAAQVDAMCEAVSLRVVDRRYGEGKAEGDRGHYVVVAEPVSRPPVPAAAGP